MAGPVRLVDVSETAMMLYLAEVIDVALAPVIGRIIHRIESECSDVLEITPSYTSILVETSATGDALQHTRNILLEIACEELNRPVSQQHVPSGKLIELPVYYHPDVGPDLQLLADHAMLTVDEVIAIHSGRDYTVCAIGFAPGFAFLAEVDERIAMPRHQRPRMQVPAGSVGIADRQTAVYPNASPGGWNLLGSCPEQLYNPGNTPTCPFEIGDRVRFVPIDRDTYMERGGRA
ncbi:MAG: 5-oxoprolinase subunit PxpB [Akkermansiaceae bacterium]|nr:5-oxoprolinase subunit PxpB [Akkermansiaceae bacterium]